MSFVPSTRTILPCKRDVDRIAEQRLIDDFVAEGRVRRVNTWRKPIHYRLNLRFG